jgi:ankyrin repeat protein
LKATYFKFQTPGVSPAARPQDDNPEAMAQLVDTTNDLGWTSLHAACEQGQANMLALLIRLGADPLRTTGSDACALSLPRR